MFSPSNNTEYIIVGCNYPHVVKLNPAPPFCRFADSHVCNKLWYNSEGYMDKECKHFLLLREDSLTTPQLELVSVVREERMQTFLPNEGKGRRNAVCQVRTSQACRGLNPCDCQKERKRDEER